MDEENRGRAEPSTFTSLFSNLTDEVRTLVRNEIQLAQAEMAAKATQAAKGAASIAIAGAVMFCGLLVLLAAAVFGLSTVMPAWLAALIVGVVVLIIGAIMVQAGRKKLQKLNLTPDRTVASFRNDKEFTKQHEEQAKEQMQ